MSNSLSVSDKSFILSNTIDGTTFSLVKRNRSFFIEKTNIDGIYSFAVSKNDVIRYCYSYYDTPDDAYCLKNRSLLDPYKIKDVVSRDSLREMYLNSFWINNGRFITK